MLQIAILAMETGQRVYRVVVTGLTAVVDAVVVDRVFSACGLVDDVEIVDDGAGRRAVVHFLDEASARAALTLDGENYYGSKFGVTSQERWLVPSEGCDAWLVLAERLAAEAANVGAEALGYPPGKVRELCVEVQRTAEVLSELCLKLQQDYSVTVYATAAQLSTFWIAGTKRKKVRLSALLGRLTELQASLVYVDEYGDAAPPEVVAAVPTRDSGLTLEW